MRTAVQGLRVTAALAALWLYAAAATARMQQPGPQMGDIVTFGPSPGSEAGQPPLFERVIRTSDRSASGHHALLAHRPGQFGCVLDLDVLRHSGGSLVVDGKPGAAGPDSWRLHWVGERTSRDMADCGQEAELILNASDVRTLAAAARRN